MDLFEELKKYGVDVEEGIDRMAGNAGLYRQMLAKFSEMARAFSADVDFEAGDIAETADQVHALKGTAGNLSVVPLYEAYTKILALLRGGDPKKAKAAYEEILPIQDKIVACIEKNI